eukprot:GFYU01005310.1.p1 GENE.GFYU01005310.1~~GFYU01005310.1.p1  ORF type:complete len:590 (+),score=141.64 GFYU01005310.1:243-2012(+)
MTNTRKIKTGRGTRKAGGRMRGQDPDASMMDVGGGGGPVRRSTRQRGRGGVRPGMSGRGPAGLGGSDYKVQIKGYNMKTNRQELLKFLQEKTRNNFRFISYDYTSRKAMMSFATMKEAAEVAKLNGITFNKQKLMVKLLNVQQNAVVPKQHLQVLGDYISKHFDPNSKYLDLGNLANQPEIMAAGVKIRWTERSFTNSLFRLMRPMIEAQKTEVVTISFANNGITALQGFFSLHREAPKVINLSFEGNLIKDAKDLDALKGYTSLREIILRGNPLHQQLSPSEYEVAIRTKWPRLQFLDGVELQGTFHVPETSVALPPLSRSFFDSADNQSFAEDFLTKFFPMFDKDPQQLIDVYSDNSVFSLTAGGPRKKWKDMNAYSAHNRNLEVIKDTDRKVKYLRHGKIDIIYIFNHNFVKPRETPMDKLTVECFVLEGVSSTPMLQLHTHGVMLEGKGKYPKAFDRTFLLGIVPGSAHPIIMNDILVIRPYPPPPLLKETLAATQPRPATPPPSMVQPLPVAPVSPTLLPAVAPAAISPVAAGGDPQEMLVIQLSTQANLDPGLARQCLNELNWDLAASLARVAEMRAAGQLPA